MLPSVTRCSSVSFTPREPGKARISSRISWIESAVRSVCTGVVTKKLRGPVTPGRLLRMP
jgi:hypothetical protein